MLTTKALLDCGHEPTQKGNSLGYGTSALGKTSCYECCAEIDREALRSESRWTGYLTEDAGRYSVSNFPGSLKFNVWNVATSGYGGGFGSPRTDVWFVFEGVRWHGVQRGNWNQILRCKRLGAR
jgi:hypothetical protein